MINFMNVEPVFFPLLRLFNMFIFHEYNLRNSLTDKAGGILTMNLS